MQQPCALNHSMERGQTSDPAHQDLSWNSADLELHYNLPSPWVTMGETIYLLFVFVWISGFCLTILLRVLKPILNHFSDIFIPTPNIEVKSWKREKVMPLVSKIIIMTMKWHFQGQWIMAKCKQIADRVPPEYDKWVGDGNFLEIFCVQKGPFLINETVVRRHAPASA